MENPQINNIFSLENSRNRELGAQIRNEIENIADHFIKIDDQEQDIKRLKKSLILEMADKFDRLHEIGEYPLPINNICSSIYRYLHRKGFDISDRSVQRVLRENAPQYMNSANTSYQSATTSSIDIKLQQEEILEALQTLKNSDPNVLKPEQMQDLIPSIYETLDHYEHSASQRNITPAPSQQAQQANYDAEELDPYRDQITTDKPDPRSKPSNLVEATKLLGESIIDCGSTIVNTAKMMEMYPPEEADIELEKKAVIRVLEWGTFWETLAEALKNGTDRKYRRSVVQWTQIADDEQNWGKHAASSKNPYVSKFKDPKTGVWKEEIRKLTREQIGDVAPKAREFALLFKRSVPACLDFIRWSEICMFPYASGLSTKLHDKLQDRSLR
jgi:hypothetical protein